MINQYKSICNQKGKFHVEILENDHCLAYSLTEN